MLGVSADSVAAQRAFRDKADLSMVGLLSDPEWHAISVYAAMHWLLPVPGRRTVLIDDAGRIRQVITAMGPLERHGDRVVEAIDALQAEDEALYNRHRAPRPVATPDPD